MSKLSVLARSMAARPSATASTRWPSRLNERVSISRRSDSSSTTRMLSDASLARDGAVLWDGVEVELSKDDMCVGPDRTDRAARGRTIGCPAATRQLDRLELPGGGGARLLRHGDAPRGQAALGGPCPQEDEPGHRGQ